MAYTDGTFTAAKQNGPKRVEFPFLNAASQDPYPKNTERDYVIAPDSYQPTAATRTSYTNNLTYSEDFSNAAWTVTELTRTAAFLSNPWDGTSTFSRFLETVTVSSHLIGHAYTFTAVPTTVFALVGAISRQYVRLRATDGTTNFDAFFDMSNNTVFGTPSNCTAAILRYTDLEGSTTFRVSITFTPLAAAGNVFLNVSTDGSTVGYAGDVTKGIFCGGVQVEEASSAGPYIVTTSAARTVLAPNIDATDNTADSAADYFAFLVGETSVSPFGSGYWTFAKRYARVPATQTSYGSSLIVRPTMHDLVSGSSYAVSFDDGATSHVFTARKTVSAVGAITPAGATEDAVYSLPSSTITIGEIGGGTTTFDTTDSASTIQTALAAGLGASSYVVKGDGSIVCSGLAIATTIKYVGASPDTGLSIDYTTDGSNVGTLTIRAVNASVDINPDTPTNIRTLSSTAHGGAVGDYLAVWNGDKLLGTTKVLAVAADTVTIRADEGPWSIGSLAATHMQFADTSSTRYVNGPVSVTTKIEESFYLPGWSAGITTAADIPLVAPKLDPISWLAAIVASTAFLPIQGSDLDQWDGPIYKQTTVSAQMSDALDTVSVSA